MARELDDWLVKGINALIDGSYTPRFLKHYYFKEEMIDQLHLSDRILQHILLKQLKPTARTLRKAREQVKWLVIDGVSPRRIRFYLHRWCTWWVRTSENWLYQDLLLWFLKACWDECPVAYATELLHQHTIKLSKIGNQKIDYRIPAALKAAPRDL
jgi:hypothetical protein